MSNAAALANLAAATTVPHDRRAFMMPQRSQHESNLTTGSSAVDTTAKMDDNDMEDADGDSDEDGHLGEVQPDPAVPILPLIPCPQMDHIWNKQFRTQDEAVAFVTTAAETAGFIIRIKGHRPNKATAHTILLCCDKARKPRNLAAKLATHESKRRNTKSKCINCPWNCRVKQSRPGWPWEVQRVSSEKSNCHNHDLEGVHSAPKHRMNAVRERGDYILREWYMGTKPSEILKMIKSEGGEEVMAVTGADVHNFLNKHKQLAEERAKAIHNAVWAGVDGSAGQAASSEEQQGPTVGQ